MKAASHGRPSRRSSLRSTRQWPCALDGPIVVHLFYEPGAGRLGLRVPPGVAELIPSPLAQVSVANRSVGGEAVVEITTRVPILFPYFHAFAISVADRVQFDGLDANTAINECVARWQDLLAQAAVLSPERQLGLVGELWLLHHLIGRLGADRALAAWTGPTGAAHDFRFGAEEIEVKTTSGEHRVHMISSDTQLLPSAGCRLHLLSLQFTIAGSDQGRSLGGWVDVIRHRLARSNLARAFEGLLTTTYGLDPSDLSRYDAHLKLRTPAYVVPIDEGFPRIVLGDMLDVNAARRISDVRYRVDVEGLGHAVGSDGFIALLGQVADVTS